MVQAKMPTASKTSQTTKSPCSEFERRLPRSRLTTKMPSGDSNSSTTNPDGILTYFCAAVYVTLPCCGHWSNGDRGRKKDCGWRWRRYYSLLDDRRMFDVDSLGLSRRHSYEGYLKTFTASLSFTLNHCPIDLPDPHSRRQTPSKLFSAAPLNCLLHFIVTLIAVCVCPDKIHSDPDFPAPSAPVP